MGFDWQPYRAPGYKGEVGTNLGEIIRSQEVSCAFCRGGGYKPRGTKCSICRGAGSVSITPPALRCAFCRGGGEEKPRSNITCTVCRGKGYVSITEPVETCSHCRGRGAEPGNKMPCLKCQGKGVIAKRSNNE